MCCGVASGFVMNAGAITTVAVPNMAICNKAPVEKVSAAVKVDGQLTGADTGATVIDYELPAANFKCFTDPAPPVPPAPTPLPSSGPGMACSSESDTCGGDNKLCCGVAMGGTVDGADPKTPSGVLLPNLAICNNKPVDGKKAAVDFKGSLMGADTASTTISFTYPADSFDCLASPAPPGPSPAPTYPKPIGVACASAAENDSGKTCMNTDKDTDEYCCGVMSGGMLMEAGDKVSTTAAPNIVVCNYNPDGEGEGGEGEAKKPLDIISLISEDGGNRITAKYEGTKFVCLSGA